MAKVRTKDKRERQRSSSTFNTTTARLHEKNKRNENVIVTSSALVDPDDGKTSERKLPARPPALAYDYVQNLRKVFMYLTLLTVFHKPQNKMLDSSVFRKTETRGIGS